MLWFHKFRHLFLTFVLQDHVIQQFIRWIKWVLSYISPGWSDCIARRSATNDYYYPDLSNEVFKWLALTDQKSKNTQKHLINSDMKQRKAANLQLWEAGPSYLLEWLINYFKFCWFPVDWLINWLMLLVLIAHVYCIHAVRSLGHLGFSVFRV